MPLTVCKKTVFLIQLSCWMRPTVHMQRKRVRNFKSWVQTKKKKKCIQINVSSREQLEQMTCFTPVWFQSLLDNISKGQHYSHKRRTLFHYCLQHFSTTDRLSHLNSISHKNRTGKQIKKEHKLVTNLDVFICYVGPFLRRIMGGMEQAEHIDHTMSRCRSTTLRSGECGWRGVVQRRSLDFTLW